MGHRAGVILFVLPTAAWMVPLFTQLHKRYPCLGNLAIAILVLGFGFTAAWLALYRRSGEWRTSSRKNVIVSAVTLAVSGIAAGAMWAPILNAWLDFGAARVVEGEIGVIDNPGKGNPTRRVSAVIDGKKLRGSFYAQSFFWDIPVVREGGKATLTVRPGFFGVPWIEKFGGRR